MSTGQQRGAQAPQTQALVQAASGPLAIVKWGMTDDQIALLKRTICRGADDDEFALFMTVAHKMGLDPFARQIHAVKRWDNDLERQVMTIQIGIDGYRLGAARTGEDDGQEGPYWCGTDGVWRDVWLDPNAEPYAAKVLVYRKGRARPYAGVALWDSYAQFTKKGDLTAMWRRHGPGQLAKCAEALALRKAFPAELAGTHTDDELGRDAIDAEFTETKPLSALPATAGPSPSSASQATSTATPASSPAKPQPAKPAEDKRPALTEEDTMDIIDQISRVGTEQALREIWKLRISTARMDEHQRARLGKAYADQLAEVKRAVAAEKGAAP